MDDQNHNADGYTTKEAADIVGISVGRIQQLAKADLIDHRKFGRNLVITRLGVEQAKKRNTTTGRPKKIAENGRGPA